MKPLQAQLRKNVERALLEAFGDQGRGIDPLLRAATDPKFGDYQSNVAMGLAKRLGRPPREVAQMLIAALSGAGSPPVVPESAQPVPVSPAFGDLAEPPEIAGPGFINIRLKQRLVESCLSSLPASVASDRLGIDLVPADERQIVVVDYSSPNAAKQMHVGHLRSTIIGDTIARVLAFEGHRVIRQNHIGDWGTQFGLILAELRDRGKIPEPSAICDASWTPNFGPPECLEQLYREANARMKADPAFADRARRTVTAFQSGHDSVLAVAWRHIIQTSVAFFIDPIYERLNVLLNRDDMRGESFYNDLLPHVVTEVQTALSVTGDPASVGRAQHAAPQAICREDQGAVCVFIHNSDGTPAFKGPEGEPFPMIIRKSDGAYLYATTDIAAVLYRTAHPQRHPTSLHTASLKEALDKKGGGLGANRVIYVVSAPQALHFQMLFATIQALGWTANPTGNPVGLEHVSFGSVLGDDRKMLRTRTGENVKLQELLDEAVQRAEQAVRQTESDADKRRGFAEGEIKDIAQAVGIGAVKYADLCQNRNSDYVFSWDKMLALSGNTAPYLLYAYARIRSIYRKGLEQGGDAMRDVDSAPVRLEHSSERALGLRILQLAETIDSVSETLLPNILCDYLYDLAGKFMVFYESCPVLQAPDDATRRSRLRLCDQTARALKIGLELLGIRTLERM